MSKLESKYSAGQQKKTPDVFQRLECRAEKNTIVGDITIEILYPDSVWKMVNRMDSGVLPEKESEKCWSHFEKIQKQFFDVYKPLIDRHKLIYNEISHANYITFNVLIMPQKMFSKAFYNQILKKLPHGYDLRVQYTMDHVCTIGAS